ncbi:MAG: polysaccharide pyruvyl transferase family protein [Candidatus Thiodiazotropha sp. (ex Lucinoma borealis)]|nr:polysaccharide pyruvyl transferase family protein [Candidatus Thiodiazotropha sp. (ex Lucinoma borealis)]
MLIEIKGVQFVNKGAELMLYAILQMLERECHDVEICINTNQNSPYIKRAKLGAYQKLYLVKNIIDLNYFTYFISKRIRDYLKLNWGIVLEADVDVILDASGFLYGDQWPTIILKQTSNTVQRFVKRGKSYMFLPQALGPFSNDASKALAYKVFKAATVVYPRDRQSYEYIKEILGDDGNYILAPDFTNLVMPLRDKKYDGLIGSIAVIPNSNMISDKNNVKGWRKNYIPILVNVIKSLKKSKKKIFLLNHEGESDKAICYEINERLNSELVIVEEENSLIVKAIIGNCDAIICSRFHGCVSALSQSIPCLGTSWSHKYDELFEEYGLTESSLLSPSDSLGDIENKLSMIFKERELTITNLNKCADIHKKSALNMWNQILSYIRDS